MAGLPAVDRGALGGGVARVGGEGTVGPIPQIAPRPQEVLPQAKVQQEASTCIDCQTVSQTEEQENGEEVTSSSHLGGAGVEPLRPCGH